jgi:hypothetical protein
MEAAEAQQAVVLAEIAQLHAAELRRQQAVIEDLSEQLAAATGRATPASGFVAATAGWVGEGAETSSEGKWRVEQASDGEGEEEANWGEEQAKEMRARETQALEQLDREIFRLRKGNGERNRQATEEEKRNTSSGGAVGAEDASSGEVGEREREREGGRERASERAREREREEETMQDMLGSRDSADLHMQRELEELSPASRRQSALLPSFHAVSERLMRLAAPNTKPPRCLFVTIPHPPTLSPSHFAFLSRSPHPFIPSLITFCY